jgi:hypothetical protein
MVLHLKADTVLSYLSYYFISRVQLANSWLNIVSRLVDVDVSTLENSQRVNQTTDKYVNFVLF